MTAVLRTFGDFGGSGTKIVFWNDLAQVFLMEPEVAEISSSRLSRLKLGRIQEDKPDNWQR